MDILAPSRHEPTEVRRNNFPREFRTRPRSGSPTTRATTTRRSTSRSSSSDSDGSRAAGRGTRREAARARALDVRRGCGLAPTAVPKRLGLRRAAGKLDGAHPPHRQGHRHHRHRAPRPGPRHVVVADHRDRVGIPFDDVEVIHGDTAFAPYGLGTYGAAAWRWAARPSLAAEVRDKARLVAAHTLEASPTTSSSRAALLGQGQPRQERHDAEVAFRAGGVRPARGRDPGLDQTVFFDPPNFTFPFGCPRLRGGGRRRPAGSRSPLRGGRRLRQRRQPDDRRRARCTAASPTSIGQALYEGAVYDEDGQLLTGSLVDT